jgi:hypothetical protein
MEKVIVRERAYAALPAQPTAPPTIPFLGLAAQNAKQREDMPVVGECYRSEKFDADEGVITISWPSNLSPQSVEDMQSWMELLMKRIERRAKAN